MKVLETAVGAVFAPTRFSLVRISIRDLVADGKSLVRKSGVGGGGQILILKTVSPPCENKEALKSKPDVLSIDIMVKAGDQIIGPDKGLPTWIALLMVAKDAWRTCRAPSDSKK